jgi:glycyl-tRNA synthetase (class II)
MYIAKQKVNGKDYYYLRKAVRENGKVISKSVAYLGKDLKEAEKKKIEIIKNLGEKKVSMIGEKRKLVQKKISIEDMATFCKRKGFVYPSAEIYGGLAGFFDYGHLGVELKNNLKNDWWNFHVRQREDVVGIDGSIITNPKVWKASGHEDSFSDIFVVCKKCKKINKIDKNELGKVKCDFCGGDYDEDKAN